MSIATHGRVIASAFDTSVRRYARSWGLWVLLLLAPIAARLWLGDPNGRSAAIAINDKAPVMTSAMLGVSLGIVVSTLLLPAAFVYFRASVTRRQPWQVAEVTAASRVAAALGHVLADLAVVAAALFALTLAGLIIGLVAGTPGGFHPLEIAFGLWVIALPAVMMAAALRRLLDALPWTRGALGEVVALGLWIAALVVPSATLTASRSTDTAFKDLAGFVQPLTASLPPGRPDIMIGGGPDTDGTIALDVTRGLYAPIYLASRLSWMIIALAMTVAAGLLYQPHLARPSRERSRLRRWLDRSPRRPATAPVAQPAAPAAHAFPNLVVAEFLLIGRGRLWRLAALLVALGSAVMDYRHAAGPAALLLLVFGMTAHIGRAEQPRLLTLTNTMTSRPWSRRGAFVLASIGWGITMGLPAILFGVASGQFGPFLLAIATAGAAALVAMALGTLVRSAFAPRLMLLLAWYVWLSL